MLIISYYIIHVKCYKLGKLIGLFQFYFEVYEETAGLMVNDPVLRTHKVSIHSLVILFILLILESL